MKTKTTQSRGRIKLRIEGYCNCSYIERVGELESALAKKPRLLHIEMIGVGEIPADMALLIRSILLKRSPKTRVITNARSSLQGGSVLVWLLGDSRFIRADATLHFRKANLPESEDKEDGVWKDSESKFWDSSEIDPEEGSYARMLDCINEFLPVKEFTGRLISVRELRQFGLVENERVDHFLSTAFAREKRTTGPPPASEAKRMRETADVKRQI